MHAITWRGLRACALSTTALSFIALAGPVLAQEASAPGVRFGQAERLTPAEAQSYFDSQPATVSYSWDTNRPAEIKALADALGNDPDRIFNFVRNNIRIVPIYGLQKGAVGALVDRSGTAFDQAQLLVETLRAAGYPTARYVIGDLTLSGAELADWLGVTSQTSASELLANGGIPVTLQATDTVSSATLGHIRVQVDVAGTTRTFDPGFKAHDVSVPLDVTSASGLSPSGFVATAIGGTTVQTENGVPYVTSVNLAGMDSALTASSNTLLTALRSSYADRSADDLLGVRKIRPSETASTAPLVGTFAPRATFTGGLPDRYRTRLSVSAGTCARTFFVDEIYARRLTFHRFIGNASPPSGLYVDGVIAGPSCGNAQDTSLQSVPISLAVNHPYAEGGGTYMDVTTTKLVDRADDVVIVHGWGETGSELQTKLASESMFEADEKIPDPVEDTGSPDGATFVQTDAGTTMVSTKSRLGASWLAQSSRTAELVRAVSGIQLQHHHSIGVAYSQAHYFVFDTNKNRVADPDETYIVGDGPRDSGLRLDLDSGYSTSRLTGDLADQLAARHTMAASLATLEGSVMEQQLDAVDTGSTAQRLPWAQENLAGTIRYHQFAAGSIAPAVATYNAGSAPVGQACTGSSLTTQGLTGLNIVQANDRMMGPGQVNPVPSVWTNINPVVPQTNATMHRGCAWIAYRPDGSYIAHVVTSLDRGLKGAGAGSDATLQEAFKPGAQADLLSDRYKDRSSINGVDLRTGAYTFTPAEDLRVGSGEFPYSLSFQRTFQAGGASCSGCAFGWTHNFDIKATASGGGLEGMGSTTSLALAGPLVALDAAFSLYRNNPNALANQVAGAGVMRWFSRQLSNNVVTVTQGPSSETFVRLADQTYAAPAGSGAVLTRNGNRRTTLEPGARSLSWLYDQVSFVRRGAGGDLLNLGWREWNPGTRGTLQVQYPRSKAFGFLATSWTFPRGVSLNFAYCESQPLVNRQLVSTCRDRLTRVTNSLGHYIDIDRLNATSSDGRSTTMVVPTTSPTYQEWQALEPESLTNSAGEVWRFEWRRAGAGDRPSPYPNLARVFAPDNTDTPMVQLTYDGLNRVRLIQDRLSVLGQRPAQQIQAAGYGSGRTIDPEGGVVSLTFDEDDRVVSQTDELGRTTRSAYDGAGRVASRTNPEGDRTAFEYDPRGNVIELRQVAKPGSGLPDQVVTAEYHTSWNKPLWIRDARNNDPADPAWNLRTDYSYVASGNGAGEVSTVTQPPVDGVRPLWFYGYGTYGMPIRTTDPTGVVTVTGYDAQGNPRSTTVDPTGVNAITCRGFDARGNQISETDARGGACQ